MTRPPIQSLGVAGGLLAVVAIGVLVGVGVAVLPLYGPLLIAAALLFVLAGSRLWLALAWFVLAGLVILSYGFNNVPVPVPGAGAVPLVNVVFLYALIAALPWWRPLVSTKLGRRYLLALMALSAVTAIRLVFDVPRYGPIAGRDALFVLEAAGVFLGYAMVRAAGVVKVIRTLAMLWVAALAWFSLLPLQGWVAQVSPTVGVQRPTPLFAFTSAAVVAGWSLFWFLQERSRRAPWLAGLAILVVLIAQTRGVYLGVALGALGVFLLEGRQGLKQRFAVTSRAFEVRRIAMAVVVAVILLGVLPPLQGRVGLDVGAGSVGAQLETIVTGQGPEASSITHRLEAWPALIRSVRAHPGGTLVGVGFGPDLFGGFAVAGGVLVRKPHNDVLEVWARTGLLGLVPWLVMLGLLVRWALREGLKTRVAWWIIALQAIMVLTALTQPYFGFAYGGMVYMMLMGIALGIAEGEQQDLEEGHSPRGSARVVTQRAHMEVSGRDRGL